MPVRNTFNTRPIPKQDMKVRDAMTDVASFVYEDGFVNAVTKRISFWREYPFHMCEHYLQVKLKPFQCVLLYQMFHNTNFCFIASRGLGGFCLVQSKVMVFCAVIEKNRWMVTDQIPR